MARPNFTPRYPPPDPVAIKAARVAAGLSMVEAAALVQVSASSWESWEYSRARMPAPVWTLFQLLTKE